MPLECQLDSFLANGRYGKIYLAHSESIKDLVVKKIDLISLTRDDKVLIQKEVEINRQLSSPYIVKFFDSYSANGYLYIQLEYCDSADLDTHISLCLQEDILHWTYQILQALDHMHQNRIVHRDIKPENILLHRSGSELVCKVADFGLSWQLRDRDDFCTTFTGSPIYMAPEIIKSEPYNHLVDLWSLGCVILELCNLRQPFDYEEIDDVVYHILKDPVPAVSEHYTHDMTVLISQLMVKDPARRPEARTILSNKMFIKYRIRDNQKFLSPIKAGPSPQRPSTGGKGGSGGKSLAPVMSTIKTIPIQATSSSTPLPPQLGPDDNNKSTSSRLPEAFFSPLPLPSAAPNSLDDSLEGPIASPPPPLAALSTPRRALSGIPVPRSTDKYDARELQSARQASPGFSPQVSSPPPTLSSLRKGNLSKITYVHSQYALRKKTSSGTSSGPPLNRRSATKSNTSSNSNGPRRIVKQSLGSRPRRLMATAEASSSSGRREGLAKGKSLTVAASASPTEASGGAPPRLPPPRRRSPTHHLHSSVSPSSSSSSRGQPLRPRVRPTIRETATAFLSPPPPSSGADPSVVVAQRLLHSVSPTLFVPSGEAPVRGRGRDFSRPAAKAPSSIKSSSAASRSALTAASTPRHGSRPHGMSPGVASRFLRSPAAAASPSTRRSVKKTVSMTAAGPRSRTTKTLSTPRLAVSASRKGVSLTAAGRHRSGASKDFLISVPQHARRAPAGDKALSGTAAVPSSLSSSAGLSRGLPRRPLHGGAVSPARSRLP